MYNPPFHAVVVSEAAAVAAAARFFAAAVDHRLLRRSLVGSSFEIADTDSAAAVVEWRVPIEVVVVVAVVVVVVDAVDEVAVAAFAVARSGPCRRESPCR